MSLLNDALRKKRSEHQAIEIALPGAMPKPAANRNRKKKWAVAVFGLAVLIAGYGGWCYWSVGSDSSDRPGSWSSAGLASAQADGDMDNPAAEPAIAPPQATSSVSSKTAVVPAAQAPTILVPSPKPPATSKARQSPTAEPVAPPKVRSTRAPSGKGTHHARRPAQGVPVLPTGQRRVVPAATNSKSRLKSESLYQKARQYHRRNQLEQAIRLYQEVIKIDPAHSKARFNLAAAYLQTGAYDKAFPIIVDLYKQEPGNQQIMLNLAIAHIGCGRFQEALVLLGKATEQPEAPLFGIFFHKAVAYSHLGRAQTAWTWYKRAEALRPDDPRLLFNMAVLSDQQQHYTEAVNYYLKYIENNPEIDTTKEKQIRRRIRSLQAYHPETLPKESPHQ